MLAPATRVNINRSPAANVEGKQGISRIATAVNKKLALRNHRIGSWRAPRAYAIGDASAPPNAYERSFWYGGAIPELTYDVVAGGLSIQNLHERRQVLCSARSASVRLLTELQNSSSVSCFEASPSASRVSSSSGVPAKPGTVRCSSYSRFYWSAASAKDRRKTP